MSISTRLRERSGHLADRLARIAVWRARATGGLKARPEPRSTGLQARGKELVAGQVRLAGHLVEVGEGTPWTHAPDPAFVAAAQGFLWLDDLAALGTADARRRAQAWTWGWIARHGRGSGPGWTADLAGRRLIRWMHHATWLLSGRDAGQVSAFHHAVAGHAAFLSRRWQAVPPGLPRFEAATALLYLGLSLAGREGLVPVATAALAAACEADVDSEGGIPDRNPEDLLKVLTHLTWAAGAMAEAGHPVPTTVAQAISRIVPVLRALRHADGALARFHGGGPGAEGRLEQALAAAGARPAAPPAMVMGFARLSGGRTTVIVDAAAPPGGRAARTAHASTTAFELASGRRALVVSCGSGVNFGPAWAQAARATRSHSALCLDGASSSRLGASGAALESRARVTALRLVPGSQGTDLHLSHDGWRASHGLTASRSLSLDHDGRRLSGIDSLVAPEGDDRRRFHRLLADSGMKGIGFSLRFHLHPDVMAALAPDDTAVSLRLRSGETWVFHSSGPVGLHLEPSAYLEDSKSRPLPGTQIVLHGRAREVETRIGWTLAKATDTPLAIRDLEQDSPDGPD